MPERGAEDLEVIFDVVGNAKRLVELALGVDDAEKDASDAKCLLADEVFAQLEKVSREVDSTEVGSVRTQQSSSSSFLQCWKSDDGRSVCTRVMCNGSWVTFVSDAIWYNLQSCEAVFRDNGSEPEPCTGTATIEFRGGTITNVHALVVNRAPAGVQVPGA